MYSITKDVIMPWRIGLGKSKKGLYEQLRRVERRYIENKRETLIGPGFEQR
jgi:hypothetical protein